RARRGPHPHRLGAADGRGRPGCDDVGMSHERLPDVPAGASIVPIPARWSDMDAYGHVNNVQYLRIFEETRVYVFKTWFGQDRDLIDEGMLVVSAAVDYLLPMEFAYAPARVGVWCSDIGAAS